MLDLSHVPTNGKVDVQTFIGRAAAVGTAWQTYTRPRGCSMLHILLMGCGGGGGSGGQLPTSPSGAGGGSGGLSTLLIPAFLLPDTFFLSIAGPQAANATTTTTAVATFASYIAISATNGAPSTNNVILEARGGATGGSANTTTGVGALGTAGAVTTIASCPLAGMGVINFYAGTAGIVGNAGTGGNAGISTTGSMNSGGAAGGGCAAGAGSAGGNINTMTPLTLVRSGGIGGASSGLNGGEGMHGMQIYKNVFQFCGGAGGGAGYGAATTAAGGRGGDAGYGSGGGGGGAGPNGSRGQGGRGGAGICVITAW